MKKNNPYNKLKIYLLCNYNAILLSNNENKNHMWKIKCENNHIFYRTLDEIKHDKICPKCIDKNKIQSVVSNIMNNINGLMGSLISIYNIIRK